MASEDSIVEGRRRKRMHKLIAWSVNFYRCWMEAGKTVKENDGTFVVFDNVDVTPAERRFLNGQWTRFANWREAYCKEKNIIREMQMAGKSFYANSTADLNLVKAAVDVYADGASHTDKLRIETYFLATMFQDLASVTGGAKGRNHKMLIQTICTLADHILPANSPLVLPLNRVYWSLRDIILVDPVWPAEFFNTKNPTAQEEYIRKHDDPVSLELRKWHGRAA